jgi:hypothetical protein
VAKTDDNDSTGEYRLLCDEYEFVVGLTKSETAADDVLRAFLEGGATNPKWLSDPARGFGTKENVWMPIPGVDYSHARYRIWQAEGWSTSRWPSPFKPEFWRSEPERGIYSQIDYRNSTARWTGPVMYNARLAKEDIKLEWELTGRPDRADYRASLIRLHHKSLLAALRVIGLLPPLVAPAAPEPSSELVELAPDEPTDEPEPKPKPELTASQQRINAVLDFVYPNGLPPQYKAIDATLIHAVERNWGDERLPNPEKLLKPSYSAIRRVVLVRRPS